MEGKTTAKIGLDQTVKSYIGCLEIKKNRTGSADRKTHELAIGDD